jgi:biotin carboxyl carrier protein
MKMEHTITAPADGVLAELDVAPGQQVEVGAVLARVEAGSASFEIQAEGERQL